LTFRNDIWGEYLTLIFQNPHNIFFGIGLGEGGVNPHNTYIGTWVQAGLIGFILIFFTMIYMIFQIFKTIAIDHKLDWYAVLPMLIVAMEMFVEGFLFL
jgi:O-antigen ligase